MIKISWNSKKLKADISSPDLPEIREYFSIANPAARFAKSFFVSKRLYAISKDGLFDIGLIDEIKKFLTERQIKHTLVLDPEIESLYNPILNKPVIQRLNQTLRPYQLEAVEESLKYGRGVLLFGTGAGKTLIGSCIIDNFHLYSKDVKKFKCLVIVPDLGLVEQTYNDFQNYGVSFTYTKWTGSNEPDLSSNVIIANQSILLSRVDINKWINDVDLLVVDEAHKVSHGSKISKLIDKIKTPNKFGLTGTLPEDNIDKWTLLGKIGPIIMRKSSHELRSESFLTNVKVSMVNIKYKDSPDYVQYVENPTDNFVIENEFLKFNPFRNKIIKSTCSKFNNNILILVNNIDHGEHLYDLLKDLTDKQVYFIQGAVDIQAREEIKQMMESNDNIVCIAINSIFSTGINIKNIHMIMFASSTKSFVRLVQSIGRGLRLNENKSKLYIIDMVDFLRYGKKHGEKRKEIYLSEKIEYSESNLFEK